MKKILAVSGGVDSMVMLQLCLESPEFNSQELVVAHFDHGTRQSSGDDAEFVKQIARKHQLIFESQQLELGAEVAEELARTERYRFLKRVSAKYGNAEIYTAHHLDDLVESVTINFIRGTGWRGLAALNMKNIKRPFLEPELLQVLGYDNAFSKAEVLKYAALHRVHYREDPTNNSDNYLRNRIRPSVKALDLETKKQIYSLWLRQRALNEQISELVSELTPAKGQAWERSWFNKIDDEVALELLRQGTLEAEIYATRPQLRDFLKAIRGYGSGKCFNLPQDHLVKFSKNQFCL